jgi:diguanylate cyclase (GGDEF)-like protein/PAS domain S-box-containing protein
MDERKWLWALGGGASLTFASLLLPAGTRTAVRLVIAVAFLASILIELHRRPSIGRRPWGYVAAGGVVALLSALVRFGHSVIANVDYPYPSPADVLAYASYGLIIVGASSFWRHRTRRADPDALVDALIVAAAAAVLIFSAILTEYIRDDQIPLIERSGQIIYSLMTITLIGQVARLAVGPGARNTAWSLLALATGLLVANDLLLLLDTTGSTWAYDAATVAAPLTFTCAMAAVMHPAATALTTAPVYQEPRLSSGRLWMLAAALLIIPGTLITADVRNTEPDIPVLAVGSIALAGLSLGRIRLLFRSRERLGDLEVALRETGRVLLQAETPEAVAGAISQTIPAITSHDTAFACAISTMSGAHYVVASNASEPRRDLPVQSWDALLSELGLTDACDESTFQLGDRGQYGTVVVDPNSAYDRAQNLALQAMAAQVTHALASIELRETTYRQRAEQRLTALVEQSADIVAVINESRSVMFASPNADRILGLNPRSLIGADIATLVHPDDVRQVLAHLARPTLPHEPAIITEARLETRDGDFRWFDITARDFRHDDEVGGFVVTARDVTEERAAKIGLRKSERWFRGLVQNSSDVIAVIDEEGVFTYASPAVDRLLGYRPDELRGRSVLEIIPEEQIRPLEGLRRELSRTRVDSRIIELELDRRDGGTRVVEVTLTDLRDDPSVKGMVLNIRDVTDRKQLEQDLRHQVLHDDLTGLGSRVQFSDQLSNALAEGRRPGSSVAVLFIDVDDFKNVNDSLGHAAGDQVLVEIAARLLGRLRLHDRAARFGGDEFAILLTDVYSHSDVTLVADRIVEELGQPISLMGREVHLSVSVGIAVDEDGSQSPEDLLRAADVAMYQAKDNGKGRWEIFRAGMADKTMERFEISNALAAAIEADELMVYFQPIVELHNGHIAGLEALVRWSHPTRGMVSPTSFIPIAESNGLILPLGRAVLHTATSQVAEWRDRGHDVYVSVNISAVQLASEGIVDEILGIVDDSGIERCAVVLELTESSLIADFELVVGRINGLRAAGLRVAIDDFGTGYSTLRYASEFSADILKIDQSFVAKLDNDEHSTIVTTVLSLADAMDAQTVAEGIETPGQHESLMRMGCELGQGYYFTKPSPAATITRALDDQLQGQTLVGR